MHARLKNIMGYIIGIGFILSGFYRIYYLGFDSDIIQIEGILKIFLYLFAYLQIGFGLMMLYKKMQHIAGWGILTLLVIATPLILTDSGVIQSCIILKILPAAFTWLPILLHGLIMVAVYKVVWGRNF